MTVPVRLPIGRSDQGGVVAISGRFANRHALITGATGKGKTSTVATMAESFSRAGVPCLIMDPKGDLAGLSTANPCDLRDPFGLTGAALRLDLHRLGPDLIARALDLSEGQSGALEVAFAFADQVGAPLSTLADLRLLLNAVGANRESISADIGLVSASSLAAVQRAALRLERDAAGAFGAPWLDVAKLPERNDDGLGVITVLDVSRVMRTAGLYGALCAFVLSELFERCPEVGDQDRPRLAVFLDESHAIFDGAPPALVRRLESVVRLIRSKGVALIFASQSPADLPAGIASQLQNRIQHGLHGTTPADQRAIRAAADSLPVRKGFSAFGAIGRLGIGQALVSLVQDDGTPGPADLVQIARPRARLGPVAISPPAADFPAVAPCQWQEAPNPQLALYALGMAAQQVAPVERSSVQKAKDSARSSLFIGVPLLVAFFVVCALINAAT